MLFYHLRAKGLCAIFLLSMTPNSHATTMLWHDAGTSEATAQRGSAASLSYRQWHIDEQQLRETLASDVVTTHVLNLPLSDGNQVNVRATRTQVLAPELAARYPTIQTWDIRGVDNHSISGVMTLDAQGLRATLYTADNDRLFLTPATSADNARYTTYRSMSERANPDASPKDWSCQSHPTDQANSNETRSFTPLPSQSQRVAARQNGEIRTFRLAITATASYTQTHGNGTKAGALGAIANTVNQINHIYKRDLGIQFQLVADNDKVIYTTAAESPFDERNLRSTMLRNQTVLDQAIGNSHYDIGHVFNASGGGIAVVGSTCRHGVKAKGATGLGSTATESLFAIDYAAHEIGHQLSARHTFNSMISACSGGREDGNAFEPGSGNTIMAYAGLCSIDNLSQRSLPQFHSKSIEAITRYIEQDAGLTCGIKQNSGNQNPSINAGADYTIPAHTPFTLSALTASDNDRDTLAYSWEQIDTGSHSNIHVDTGSNAIIRVASLTSHTQRSIPPVKDLIAGTTPAGEILPASSRTLNFRLQARDQQGGIAYDDMRINVHNTTGTFAVTFPQQASDMHAGSLLGVAWNVANTHLAPIHCSHVDIDVTDDGGNRFTNLIRNTPNDGSATVTLPATLGSTATIRVKCSNNIFFALSGTQPPVAKHNADNTANNGTSGSTGTSINSGSNSNEDSAGGGGGSLTGHGLVSLALLTLLRRRYNCQ